MLQLKLRLGDRRPSIGLIGGFSLNEERVLRQLGASLSDPSPKLNQPFDELAHYYVPMPMARRLFNRSHEPHKWRQPYFMQRKNGLIIDKDVITYYRNWLAAEKEMAGVKRNNEEVIDRILARHNIFPSFFAREPKLHQKAGMAFFLLNYELDAGHIMLFDEMRTGKSKQTIDIARFLLQNKMITNVLIVCTSSTKRVWLNELRKDAPLYSCLSTIIQGTKDKRRELWNSIAYFYIINYESLRVDFKEAYMWQNNRPGNWLLIADEVHKLKALTSKQTKVMLGHSGYNHDGKRVTYDGLQPDYSLSLTGTPVANAPVDVFSICNFACPGILEQDIHFFKNKFATKEGRKGGKITGYKHLDEIRWRLARISVRRKRADIMFDEAVIMERYGTMVGEQKEAYFTMRDSLYAEIEGVDGEVTAVEAQSHMAKIVRLQQIADGYLSPEPGTVIWFKDFGWKIQELDDIVDDYLEDMGKLVIWSRFVPPLKLLLDRYSKHNALIIRGQMGDKAIDNMYLFQRDPKYKIMLAQIQTSEGKGFQPATTAVFLDKWWSPHLNQQAADRIVGIENPVTVCLIPLITEGTIDERIEFLLAEKKEWSDAITGDVRENEIVLPKMDKQTLLYLLANPQDAKIFEEAMKNGKD